MILVLQVVHAAIQYENLHGHETRVMSENLLEQALELLYEWQDKLEFSGQEMKRNVARFGVEFTANLDQLERYTLLNYSSENQIDENTTVNIYLISPNLNHLLFFIRFLIYEADPQPLS